MGLGDAYQHTDRVIAELLADLAENTGRAQVFIVTVKINDFATDSLLEITKQLRQKYPKIPCLLAVTCLHQLYPPNTVDFVFIYIP